MAKNENSTGPSDDSYEQEATKRKATIIKHIVFYAIWAFVFGIEYTYRKALFDKSIELQIEL